MKNILVVLFILASCSALAQDNEWENLNKQEIQFTYQENYQKAIEVTFKALQLAEKDFGKGHKNYLTSLGKLAKLYDKTGEIEKAKSSYIELIDLKKKVEGDNKQAYAYYYKKLADIYYESKEYSKAEPLYIEIVEINKHSYGEKSIEYANSMSNLASVYVSTYNIQKAIPLYSKLLPIQKKLLGGENEDYLDLLNNVAFLYYHSKYYLSSLPLFIEIAEINKKQLGKNHPDYAVSLYMLADVYSKLYKYTEAISACGEAMEIDKKAFGENSTEFANSLNRMALLHKKTANYNEAENLYIQSVAIYKLQVDEYYHDYAQSLSDLASLYIIIDKNAEAEALLIEAIDILKDKPGDIQLSYSGLLNELAILYQNLGNYDKAESLYLESSEIDKKTKGETHESYAQSLNNLASLYEIKEDYAKAEQMYKQAIEIKEKVYGDNHSEYALSLDNLASLYVKMQDYSKAKAMLLKAAAVFKNKKGEKHPDYAISILNLAGLNQQTGNYTEAETQYLQALAIFQKVYGTEHPNYANTINMLASLYEAMGKYSKAEPLYKQTNELYNKQINRNFAFMSETEKELFLKSISDYFDIYHSFALRYKNQKPDFVSLNYDNELVHKGMILKSSILLQQALINSNNKELKTLYDGLLNTKKLLSIQYALPVDKRTENTDSLENMANEMEKSLNIQTQKLPEFKQRQNYYASPTWVDIQKTLKANETAIEFIRFYYCNEKGWTDSIYYCALVLRKEYKYPKMIYLCEERELINCMTFTSDNSKSIDDFYSLIGTRNNEGETGYFIYKLIWQPIEDLLKGIHTIYFAPAGLLHKISFNAIPMPDKQYLSDKYKLNQVSSTAIAGSKDESFGPDDGNSSVIYGGINYNTSIEEMLEQSKKILTKTNQTISHICIPESKASTRGMAWNYLPGTLKEANGISNVFVESKLQVSTLSGAVANEESFKALVGSSSPTIIHIATHGFFFPDSDKEYYKKSNNSAVFQVSENPLLRSGLLFSGANAAWNNKKLPPELEDGILTAQEISQINLFNTKLVVMSACETGLGEIKDGEGVFGLQRSFKMAGVKYILMSLWQVPDEQTSELMHVFYKNLLKGKPVREAFASAQNEIKDKYKDNPFLWAAFVLVE